MEQKQRLIELRISTGMNRREFADYFEIPYRKMPEYLLRLMAYKIRIEKARGIVDDQEDVEEI